MRQLIDLFLSQNIELNLTVRLLELRYALLTR